MENVIIKIAQDVESKWTKVLQHKTLSIEKRIQRVFRIPEQDIKNIIIEKKS